MLDQTSELCKKRESKQYNDIVIALLRLHQAILSLVCRVTISRYLNAPVRVGSSYRVGYYFIYFLVA